MWAAILLFLHRAGRDVLFLLGLFLLFVFWGWLIAARLRQAARMRAGDIKVIDKVRKSNKKRNNRIVMSIGRAGKHYSLFAVLHHTGRKSGKTYTTPVRLVYKDQQFIIPLTYGDRADWYQNLLASGKAQITWQGQTYAVGHPERLEVSAAAGDFPAISRILFRFDGLPGFVRVTIEA
jgi:deazaflavin-dependent oxidoreductase (nitroreductase family)